MEGAGPPAEKKNQISAAAQVSGFSSAHCKDEENLLTGG